MTDLGVYIDHLSHATPDSILSDRTMALMMDTPEEDDQRKRLGMLRYEAAERHGIPRERIEAWVGDTGERYIRDPAGFRAAALRAPAEEDAFLACFHTLDTFPEEEAKWLIPGWIPEGQVTTMAADGGTGKTSAWVDIVAGLSSGRACLLDGPGLRREALQVAFLTTEDSVRKKLRRKLREAGANMRNIITPDFLADKAGLLRGLKFGSPEMERFIRRFHPALCVFDPVQGFIPPEINMGSRNAMRDCLAPLVTLGEECNTTSLIIAHTNKRKGAFGRDRIADSADLWDISRSVIMMGYTGEQGVRYLSNEKNNYAPLQETILFSINGQGLPRREGTSGKRDREYQLVASAAVAKPKREDCKGALLAALEAAGGSMPSKELEERMSAVGYSVRTVRRAKDDLKAEGRLQYHQTGTKKEKVWHVQLLGTEPPQLEELPADTQPPFDGPPLAVDGEQLTTF